jgi:hypothetical protein
VRFFDSKNPPQALMLSLWPAALGSLSLEGRFGGHKVSSKEHMRADNSGKLIQLSKLRRAAPLLTGLD